MIQETISNYLAFIRSYMPPKERDCYKFRGYPLIILQLNVELKAVKKKKKKSRKEKREEGAVEEESMENIFYEPNLDMVEEVLLMPFDILETISTSFNKIEKELIPLLNMDPVASYPLTKDDPVLSEPSDEVIGYVKEASRRPLEILSYFKAFSHLIEKSTSSILKKLFPEKSSISYLDKDEI